MYDNLFAAIKFHSLLLLLPFKMASVMMIVIYNCRDPVRPEGSGRLVKRSRRRHRSVDRPINAGREAIYKYIYTAALLPWNETPLSSDACVR